MLAFPGMTVTALGMALMEPTVDTRQISCSAAIFWMARTSLEALTKASRRVDMGVVPA